MTDKLTRAQKILLSKVENGWTVYQNRRGGLYIRNPNPPFDTIPLHSSTYRALKDGGYLNKTGQKE